MVGNDDDAAPFIVVVRVRIESDRVIDSQNRVNRGPASAHQQFPRFKNKKSIFIYKNKKNHIQRRQNSTFERVDEKYTTSFFHKFILEVTTKLHSRWRLAWAG